jgi:hypothetical protein
MKFKRDANHQEIIDCYRALGCTVADTHRAGRGCPDIFVGVVGISDPVEIKTEDGRLLPSQQTFIDTWRGSPVRVVRTQADVIEHVTEIRRRSREIIAKIMLGPER